MWLMYAIVTTLLWGLAELFYKKGAVEREKYSHLKICVMVGLVMGIHAVFTLLTEDIGYSLNYLWTYLPVSACYILSMAFSFFGMRFIEESISDPIENTSGAMCALMLAFLFPGDAPSWMVWVAIGVITVGVVGIGILENSGDLQRRKRLGKKLAIVAFCMPFLYAFIDAVGCVIDEIYLNADAASGMPLSPLMSVGATAENIELVANVSYELTFALVGLVIFIFMKAKGVKFGSMVEQKDKALAAVCETAGQLTYVFAMADGPAVIVAPILSCVCVVSLILSHIFLKEKLNKKQYVCIALIIVGVLGLSVFEEMGADVYTASAPGYASDVTVEVILDDEDNIEELTVDVSGETEGVGTACADEAWLAQFVGKAGPFAAGENGVETLSGATVTSNGVIEALNKVYEELNAQE